MYRVTEDIRDCLPSCALYRRKSITLIGTFHATNVAAVHTGHEINHDFKTCVATDSFFLRTNVSLSKQNLLTNASFFLDFLKFILKQSRRFF